MRLIIISYKTINANVLTANIQRLNDQSFNRRRLRIQKLFALSLVRHVTYLLLQVMAHNLFILER